MLKSQESVQWLQSRSIMTVFVLCAILVTVLVCGILRIKEDNLHVLLDTANTAQDLAFCQHVPNIDMSSKFMDLSLLELPGTFTQMVADCEVTMPKTKTVLVGLFSTAERFERRALIRMAFKPLTRGTPSEKLLDLVFVLCSPKIPTKTGPNAVPSNYTSLLQIEQTTHGDLLILDTCEDEQMNNGKSIFYFREVYRRWEARVRRVLHRDAGGWNATKEESEQSVRAIVQSVVPYEMVLKMDDDTFAVLPNLWTHLANLPDFFRAPSHLRLGSTASWAMVPGNVTKNDALKEHNYTLNVRPGHYQRVYWGQMNPNYAYGWSYGVSWDLCEFLSTISIDQLRLRGPEDDVFGLNMRKLSEALQPLPPDPPHILERFPGAYPRVLNKFSNWIDIADHPSSPTSFRAPWRRSTILVHRGLKESRFLWDSAEMWRRVFGGEEDPIYDSFGNKLEGDAKRELAWNGRFWDLRKL
ncbi:hypothetical protein HDU93_007404 [Gonapodya sp. JEL0774]|nr:hypothetical protein HDU93_007404 [Gonapodya sp. JEL0774]